MSVSWYRDRHGKIRWRYRKGKICVQLPGRPGDLDFIDAVKKAERGQLTQIRRPRGPRPHPLRELLVSKFARDVVLKAKHRARGKRIPFSLTAANIEEQLASQQEEPAFRPSLDRIRPMDGYVSANIRVVAFIANIAMNDWGESHLWRLAEMMLTSREGRQVDKNE